MAYVTIFYNNMVPTISTIHAILNVNGQSFSPGTEFSGQKFDFGMNNGQKWNLYTSLPITIIFTVQGITFKQSFTGSLRVAINTGPSVATILDQHANKIPIGGNVKAQTSGNEALMTFDFKTTGEGTLLMFAMPHHQQIIDSISLLYNMKLNTLKG